MFSLGVIGLGGAIAIMFVGGPSWAAAMLGIGTVACISTGGVISRIVTNKTGDVASATLDRAKKEETQQEDAEQSS
mgnify:FL=1